GTEWQAVHFDGDAIPGGMPQQTLPRGVADDGHVLLAGSTSILLWSPTDGLTSVASTSSALPGRPTSIPVTSVAGAQIAGDGHVALVAAYMSTDGIRGGAWMTG